MSIRQISKNASTCRQINMKYLLSEVMVKEQDNTQQYDLPLVNVKTY